MALVEARPATTDTTVLLANQLLRALRFNTAEVNGSAPLSPARG
jgi:hypothetical protein